MSTFVTTGGEDLFIDKEAIYTPESGLFSSIPSIADFDNSTTVEHASAQGLLLFVISSADSEYHPGTDRSEGPNPGGWDATVDRWMSQYGEQRMNLPVAWKNQGTVSYQTNVLLFLFLFFIGSTRILYSLTYSKSVVIPPSGLPYLSNLALR